MSPEIRKVWITLKYFKLLPSSSIQPVKNSLMLALRLKAKFEFGFS